MGDVCVANIHEDNWGAMTLFYGSIRSTQLVLENIIEIDTAMTNLRKVMSDSTDFSKVFDDANDSAERFATTIKGALDAYQVAAKAGFGQEDLKFITDAALVTANVGEMSQEQATESLISALIQYKKEAKDAMSIIDSWNNLSNKNATTVKNLSQGFSKAASTANSFQVSMHELNALIGTVTASTKQSGNEIGNFLKTAMPRLLMSDTQGALKSIGVDFMKNAKEMKSAFAIYEEVAKKFESGQLTNIQQNEVAEALGGKRHISRMTALLNNWQLIEKQMADSTDSQNSALIENEKFMESLQARINELKRSFENLSIEIGNSFLTDSFIGIVDALTNMAKGASWVSKNIGVLPILFGTIGVATVALSGNFRGLVSSLLFVEKGAVRSAIALGALKISLRSLASATVVGGVFVVLGFAMEKLISGISKASEGLDESTKKLKTNANQFEDNANRIDKLVDKYEELKPKAEKSTEAQDELRKVMEELHDIAPQLTGRIDEQGESFNLNAERARVYADTLRDMSKEQQTLLKEQLKLQIIDKEKELEKETKKLQENKEEWHETLSAIQDVEKEYGSLDQAIRELENRKSPDMSMIDKADIDAQIAHIRVLKEEILETPYGEQEILVKQLEKSMESLNQDLDSVSDSLNGASTVQESLSDSIEGANQPIQNQLTALEDLQKTISDSTKQIDLLKKAEKELQEQGYLSQDTLDQLMLTYQDFGDILGGTEEDLYSFITAKTDEKIAFINTEKDKTNALIEQTQIRIDALKTEYELYDRAQAIQQKRLESQVKQGLISPEQADLHMRNFYLRSGAGILSGISQAQKELEEAQGRLNYLDYTEKNIGRDSDEKKDKKPKKSDEPQTFDLTDAIIRRANAEAEASQKSIDSLERQIKMTDDYNEKIELTNKLIDAQESHISELKSANTSLSNKASDIRSNNPMFDTEAWFDSRGEATEAYYTQLNSATRKEQEHMQKVFNALQKIKQAWYANTDAIKQENYAIKENKNSILDYSKSILDQRKEYADKMVDLLKESKRKEHELEMAHQRKRLDDLADGHNEEMEYLDERLSKYEDIINAQLKSLDREADGQDYNKQLTEEQTKLQDIQSKINIAQLDDSVEGQARLAELKKEYAEQEKRIEEMQLNRSRDLRRQNLQDSLDTYRKDTEAKKKSEQDKYDAARTKIEDHMENLEWQHNEWLADEQYFQNKREEIIRKGYKGVEEEFKGFLDRIKKYNEETVRDMNVSWQGLENIKGDIDEAPTAKGSGNEINQEKKNDWNTYLKNKKEAARIREQEGYWPENLNQANNALRSKWGFPDGSYDALKKYPMTFHRGGVIGGNTNRIGKMIHEMFNLKPGEQMVKALNGEVVINPMRLPKPTFPNITPRGNTASQSNQTFRFDKLIHIENIEKDVDVDRFMDKLDQKFKGYGFVLD
jgi:TP901 family phage tail tape measure protein